MKSERNKYFCLNQIQIQKNIKNYSQDHESKRDRTQ